jgi:hypothetical protein
MTPAGASAHDLRAEIKVGADAIRLVASYEGEDPAQEATVTLTSAGGEVVASGKTDDRGVWSCPRPSPGSYLLVVEQTGHRTKKDVVVPGDGTTAAYTPDRLDKRVGVAVGLGAIAVLGLVFKFARRKSGTAIAP